MKEHDKASAKKKKSLNEMEVIGEEQQDNHLQIRGESDSGQLMRTILPDNFLFIPIWNVGSQTMSWERTGPGTGL